VPPSTSIASATKGVPALHTAYFATGVNRRAHSVSCTLSHASPPIAQAWCQTMLDTRGGALLSAQVQNDLLLRATGGMG